MSNLFYHAGCTMRRYKGALVGKMTAFLRKTNPEITEYSGCCRAPLHTALSATVITVCPGCESCFSSQPNITTVTLWEYLAEANFPFPDYKGENMALHDSCVTSENIRMHDAVRRLLYRMNIAVIEPEKNRTETECCQLQSQRGEFVRAGAMPLEKVAVYCGGCMYAMFKGGKKPRHLLDLLFYEETVLP